jgi:hypothetical protein
MQWLEWALIEQVSFLETFGEIAVSRGHFVVEWLVTPSDVAVK